MGVVGGRLQTTWPKVLAWRMRRHLLDPLGEVDDVDVVRQLCGVQAQVPATAALAVRVRQQSSPPGGVDRALEERRLMRTWAMRGTLHLLAPSEAGAYLSLVGAARSWERGSWQKAFGVAPDEMVALVEAVGQVLDGRALSRDELVVAVGELLGRSDLEAELRSGWGAVLKPVAWQGALCHATSDGNRVSFARPDQWLPDWAGVPDPVEAAKVVIPAYLRAYGPATPERFDAWLTRGTSKKAAVRSWFAGLEDRLATVEIDGDPALLLAEDVDSLDRTSPTRTVRLLPAFDQYVLGPGTKAEEIIAPPRRAEVSRTAGWISPVVVAGGGVVGTWEIDDRKPQVRLFEEADPIRGPALDAEIARIEELLKPTSSVPANP
jgi:Winged helix DNA-binding domain